MSKNWKLFLFLFLAVGAWVIIVTICQLVTYAWFPEVMYYFNLAGRALFLTEVVLGIFFLIRWDRQRKRDLKTFYQELDKYDDKIKS